MEKSDMAKVLFLLSKQSMTHTKLMKLLYICELFSVDTSGKRFTNLDFVHYHHGPYVSGLLDSLVSENKVTIEDDKLIKLVSNDDFKVSKIEAAIVSDVVDKWGAISLGEKNGSGIMNYVYHTLPFIETHFGKSIDFLRYKRFGLAEITIKNKDFKRIKSRVIAAQDITNYLLSEVGIARIEEEVNVFFAS